MWLLQASVVASFIITAFFCSYEVTALKMSEVNTTYHSQVTELLQVVPLYLKTNYIKFLCYDVWKYAETACVREKFTSSQFSYDIKDPLNDNGFHMCLFEKAQLKIKEPSACSLYVKEASKRPFSLLVDHIHASHVNENNEAIPLKRILYKRNDKNVQNLFLPFTFAGANFYVPEFWTNCSISAHKVTLPAIEGNMQKTFRHAVDPTIHEQIVRDRYGAIFANCLNGYKETIKYIERAGLQQFADKFMGERLNISKQMMLERHGR